MQSRNEMSRITKFEKQNPETYSPMTVKEFLEAKKATEIFSSEEEDDNRFVRQFLMLFKPRAQSDFEGFVYVYQKKDDSNLVKSGELPEVLLFKIGRTKNRPEHRVQASERANKEAYELRIKQKTKFHKYLENAIHELLKEFRVVKPDLKDGKTEWFLCPFNKIQKAVNKVQKFIDTVY